MRNFVTTLAILFSIAVMLPNNLNAEIHQVEARGNSYTETYDKNADLRKVLKDIYESSADLVGCEVSINHSKTKLSRNAGKDYVSKHQHSVFYHRTYDKVVDQYWLAIPVNGRMQLHTVVVKKKMYN